MGETGEPRKTRGKPPRGWRAVFLRALAQTCNVAAACRAAAVGRATVYRHRERDPKFADAYDDAFEQATDLLELECRRRAIEGVDRPVFYKGRQVGTVKVYSDRLLIFLLEAARPEKYRNNLDLAKMAGQIAREAMSIKIPRQREDPTAVEPRSCRPRLLETRLELLGGRGLELPGDVEGDDLPGAVGGAPQHRVPGAGPVDQGDERL
jgi:hypothetical protein